MGSGGISGIGEGHKDVQTSSYNINKFWRGKTQHGD